MKYTIAPLAILTLLSLSACGGGGGSTPSGTPAIPPINTPATPPVATPTPAVSATNQAVFSITAPTRGVAISGATFVPLSEIVATITTINGNQSFVLPTGATAKTITQLNSVQTCTNPSPCSITVPAPAGSIAMTVTAYAGTIPVATASTTYNSTGLGQTQSLTLGGIVDASHITFTSPTQALGTAATFPLNLVIPDLSGATILDTPFANPITVALQVAGQPITGTANELEITGAGATPSTSLVLTDPSQLVQLDYNGSPYTPFQINFQTANYSYAPQSTLHSVITGK